MPVKIRQIDAQKAGLFICYTYDDEEQVKQLEALLKKNGLNCWSDAVDNEASQSRFEESIKSNIRECRVGILFCTKKALKSRWVIYELGLFKGLKKPVVFYFPEEFDLSKYAMLQEYERANDVDGLIKKATKLFHAKEWLSQKTINSGKIKEVELCLSFTTPDMIKNNHLKFGCLLVSMYRYGNRDDIPEEKCFFKEKQERTRKKCVIIKKSACAWENDNFKAFPETTVLNQPIDGTISEIDKYNRWDVKYVLPILDGYGLTFKCYVDVTDETFMNKHHVKIILDTMKDEIAEVTFSDSAEGNRIYFLLKDIEGNHLIHLYDPFVQGIKNNFLCPRCFEAGKEILTR
jgi:hypothetical protein